MLTDSDYGKKTENRAEDLKEKFKNDKLIQIEVSKKQTFEKDIIEANKTAKGKGILLKALKKTKPQNGKKFEKELGDSDIDVDSFFKEIDDYKSEFAFNLKKRLEKEGEGFTIPKYITDGFDFLKVDGG